MNRRSENRRSEIPGREWLAVVLPVGCSLVLLVAAFTNGTGLSYGWAAILSCFAAGAATPLGYTLFLLREGRLFLRDAADIRRNRDRIGTGRVAGWILGAGLLAVGVGLAGLSRAVFLATLGGHAFGFWPGLLANFLRLRREHHWG